MSVIATAMQLITYLQETQTTTRLGIQGMDYLEQMKRAVLRAIPPDNTDGHEYLSTSCWHGDHNYCNHKKVLVQPSGNMDEYIHHKKPAECKFCNARCICPCHGEGTMEEFADMLDKMLATGYSVDEEI